MPPGGGPPPHVHSREEEASTSSKARSRSRSASERIVATAGTFANMPVGTPHSFKNESDKPARMLISVAPAGLEKMFFEVGVPLSKWATRRRRRRRRRSRSCWRLLRGTASRSGCRGIEQRNDHDHQFRLSTAALLLFMCHADAVAEEPARPLIVAHRGLLQHAPENTLSNFRACLEFVSALSLTYIERRMGIWSASTMTPWNGPPTEPAR